MKQWSVAKLNKERAGAIAEKYDLPPIPCDASFVAVSKILLILKRVMARE